MHASDVGNSQQGDPIARTIGRCLRRLVERDAENSYLSGETVGAGPMNQLAAQGTELQAGAIAIDRGWAPIQWKTNIRLFPLSKHLAGHDASIDVDQAEEQDL